LRRGLLALGAVATIAAPLGPSLAAHAEGTTSSPSSSCEAEKLIYELAAYAIGKQAKPETGAEVARGSSVSFEAESEWPLTFYVASSEEKTPHPDIDQGTGSAEHGENATKYVFVSTRAAASEGTVYWIASFKRALPSCGGEERTFYTTSLHEKAHTLVVLPPAATPEPPPAQEAPPSGSAPTSGSRTSWSAGAKTGSGLSARIGITAAKLIHLRGTALAYLIDCTVACSGQTSAQGWLLGPHRKQSLLKIVRCGPRHFKVADSGGGHLHITCRFRGAALRRLRALLAHRKRVRLQISATAKASGSSATLRVARSMLLQR